MHRVLAMLDRTAHRPAGLDVEGDESIVVKGNGSERGLVNRQQTQGLVAPRRREEFAILKGNVELDSVFAFVQSLQTRQRGLRTMVNVGNDFCWNGTIGHPTRNFVETANQS